MTGIGSRRVAVSTLPRPRAGHVGTRAAGRLSALALVVGLATSCASDPPTTPLSIALATDTSSGAEARVRVSGLSSAELDALSRLDWSSAEWQRLLAVTVEGQSDVAVAGRYEVADAALDFVPAFPFDAGRSYQVRFDPSVPPMARTDAPLTTTIRTNAADLPPEAFVTDIYPSADEWPANLLRFYIHFSDAMSRDIGVPFVRLIDADGQEVVDALLAAPVDFWSPDQRRYTVFFDPGRVKTDLVPNQELGRALVPGRQYAIVVSRDWPDAHGRPLREAYRKTFTVSPPIDRPIALADWTMTTPAAGTRDPLVVRVPWALDHALLNRGVGVAQNDVVVDGAVTVGRHETEWRFEPAAPWQSARYDLVALAALEDPSGNLIDQAFEVDPSLASTTQPRPDRYRVPFTVR